jgi:hypothetical protein
MLGRLSGGEMWQDSKWVRSAMAAGGASFKAVSNPGSEGMGWADLQMTKQRCRERRSGFTSRATRGCDALATDVECQGFCATVKG